MRPFPCRAILSFTARYRWCDTRAACGHRTPCGPVLGLCEGDQTSILPPPVSPPAASVMFAKRKPCQVALCQVLRLLLPSPSPEPPPSSPHLPPHCASGVQALLQLCRRAKFIPTSRTLDTLSSRPETFSLRQAHPSSSLSFQLKCQLHRELSPNPDSVRPQCFSSRPFLLDGGLSSREGDL